MPKIPVTTPEVTLDSIFQQICEIEYLLEGRVDSDNIQIEGSDISKIGGGTIYGAADFARPIVADKLIADLVNGNEMLLGTSFKLDIYDDLIDKIESRPQFDILQAKFAFDITNKPKSIQVESQNVLTPASSKLTALEKERIEAQKKSYAEYEKKLEEYINSKEDNSTKGRTAVGLFAASTFGLDAGAGVTILQTLGLGSLFGSNNPPPEISGLSILGSDYLQTKYIKHPPNYKICSMSTVFNAATLGGWSTRSLGPFMGGDIEPYENIPFISSSISIKGNWESNSDFFSVPYGFIVTAIDPETTAITMFTSTKFRAVHADDYLTILCDADVVFKVIP